MLDPISLVGYLGYSIPAMVLARVCKGRLRQDEPDKRKLQFRRYKGFVIVSPIEHDRWYVLSGAAAFPYGFTYCDAFTLRGAQKAVELLATMTSAQREKVADERIALMKRLGIPDVTSYRTAVSSPPSHQADSGLAHTRGSAPAPGPPPPFSASEAASARLTDWPPPRPVTAPTAETIMRRIRY